MFCYGSSSASYYNMYICMSKNARNAGGCDGNVDVKPTYDIYEILLLLLLYCATSRLSYIVVYTRMHCSRL